MARAQDANEKAKRRYFHPVSGVKPTVVGALVLIVAIAARQQLGSSTALVVLVGVIIGVFGIARLAMSASKPSDQQMDSWLHAALAEAERDAHRKLGFDPLTSGARDANTVRQAPLTIFGPIIWTTNGIPNADLVWKVGNDKLARFAVYRVTVILLTQSQLGSYSCDYNFLRNVRLNEQTDEYAYVDVVSVSTRETATNYTLPTGMKLSTAEQFRLSVSSGESIAVTISSGELKRITGTDRLPDSGAEAAIATIRRMLRDKKGTPGQPAAAQGGSWPT
jgi:hypothetical protein